MVKSTRELFDEGKLLIANAYMTAAQRQEILTKIFELGVAHGREQGLREAQVNLDAIAFAVGLRLGAKS